MLRNDEGGYTDTNRIGVFICHCGINIASTVDVNKVTEYISKYPGIVYAENYRYMCSDPGQKLISDTIKNHKLTGVVIACCSPTLHENTFRRLSANSGLNAYMCEIANIREQCSWVHEDKTEATEKAITIIKTIIEKTKGNESLIPVEVPVTKKALVIGGGISGIQAALDIADAGQKVILVEQSPSIGGHMAQLSETFPTLDCSQCILTPKMVDVAQNPNVTLYTYSEIEDVDGYVGNFKVTIRKKARYVDEQVCTGCGDCMNSCPVQNSPQITLMPKYSEQIEEKEIQKLNRIMLPYLDRRGSLIQVLQDINIEYNYLPEFALKYVAEKLNTPLSEIYHIATFYTAFSLEPRGEHLIKVCMGTACHARGAPRILDEIERNLGIRAGETTKDKKFTLTTVNCLGCCAFGPVVVIDEDYHTVKPSDIKLTLEKYQKS